MWCCQLISAFGDLFSKQLKKNSDTKGEKAGPPQIAAGEMHPHEFFSWIIYRKTQDNGALDAGKSVAQARN